MLINFLDFSCYCIQNTLYLIIIFPYNGIPFETPNGMMGHPLGIPRVMMKEKDRLI